MSTQDQVLTVDDYLSVYVLEWTLHHLDLTAHVVGVPGPLPEGLAHSRAALERIAGAAFPRAFSDEDVLVVGTGRQGTTEGELAELGSLASRLPFVLG
ncbi:hypothetical protein H4687_002737 [Streptomyces stelliscabiei]|uniref:Uncharacterized protein n=1 Tax=Streptomyces stelliscabiei TaxID=146820 RepID=A0A8I0NZL1_9ACTN|nr:hypothetical protein [Streptomyces stelliscabiei]